MKLTKVETGKKKGVGEQPVLDVIIGCMKADIVDRKWDTQGSVSMKEVAILDYVTKGELVVYHSKVCMRKLCIVNQSKWAS